MNYYYISRITNAQMIHINNASLDIYIDAGLWFPNTKAKVNQLLTIMKENDFTDDMPDILDRIIQDLKSAKIFKNRNNLHTKTFNRMLKSNIEQIDTYRRMEFDG